MHEKENGMRGIFIFLVVISLIGGTHAITIDSPERIPSYAPFTFTATLPSTETFTTSTVLFDGILVATLYPSGACLVQPDWNPFVIKCDTFDNDPKTNEGLTLIFTHTGFALGEHTISIQTQGIKSENQTVNLKVFNALDASEKDQIDADVNELTTQVESLQTKTTETEQKWYESKSELETKVNENDQRVEEVHATIALLNDDYQKRMEEAKKGFQIPFLSGNNDNAGAGTGLATGSNAPLLGLSIIIVGIALFAFFTLSRRKNTGFSAGGNSGGFFEGNMDALFKSVPQNSSGKVDPQPHKWAAESGGEKSLRADVEDNPPEKVNFGELIRNERP